MGGGAKKHEHGRTNCLHMMAYLCTPKSRGLTCIVGYSVVVMVVSIGYIFSKKTSYFVQHAQEATESTHDLNEFQIQRWKAPSDDNDTSHVIHSSYFSGIEDIMSMIPPTTLKNYKNPCWLETRTARTRSIQKLRCLPYFHVAGVCKSGTTDLFLRMTHHPSIISNNGTKGKETWYWSRRRYGLEGDGRNGKTMTLYNFIDLFNASSIEGTVDENGYHSTITGHADPMDLWEETNWRKIPENAGQFAVPKITKPTLIHHINPNVKVIFLLRNPIERTYSHFFHWRMGKTSKQFHNYVIKSTTAARECLEKFDVRTCIFKKNSYSMMQADKGLIWIGMYSVYLLEWLKVFPRNQILVVRSEDYMRNVTKTLSLIFKFLEVEQLSANNMEKIANLPFANPSRFKDKAGPMLFESRDILYKFYLPYNKELAEMLYDPKYMWSRDISYFDFNY